MANTTNDKPDDFWPLRLAERITLRVGFYIIAFMSGFCWFFVNLSSISDRDYLKHATFALVFVGSMIGLAVLNRRP